MQESSSSSNGQEKISTADFIKPSTVPSKAGNDPNIVYPQLTYEKPDWGARPSSPINLEVLKNGSIAENFHLSEKDHFVIGRLPVCDICPEHPSTSRYHLILQFKHDGSCYLYDLASTHGTYLNKERLQPRRYYSIKNGDMFRVGESSRLYIIFNPNEPEIPPISPSKASPTSDVSWGFSEDAPPESEATAIEGNDIQGEQYYHRDPKKALRAFFEQRGLDMEFEFEEEGKGPEKIYRARIRLPVEDLSEFCEPMYGEGDARRKREAERVASLDACIKLDKLKILRGGNGILEEKKKKLKALLGDDDSDEDTFYDRTGDVEKHRLKKDIKSKKQGTTETITTLLKRRNDLLEKEMSIANQLEGIPKNEGKEKSENEDDLDAYMTSLEQSIDEEKDKSLKSELSKIRIELQRVEKLIKIVEPVLPPYVKPKPEELMQTKANLNPENKMQEIVESGIEIAPAENSESHPPKKKRKVYTVTTVPGEYGENSDQKEEVKPQDEELVDWRPPEGQVGDGKTHLNAKFGY